MANLNTHLDNHRRELIKAAETSSFVIFLCGPTLDPEKTKPSAQLRADLYRRLVEEGFEVILGEDQGLEDTRLRLGVNAQDNELEFIRQRCNAVIVIADSVGAFCELGLFSWHYAHQHGTIDKETDFILLVDKKHQYDKSYLNEGPFNAVLGFGHASFVDLTNYTFENIIVRLKSRRGAYIVDTHSRSRQPD